MGRGDFGCSVGLGLYGPWVLRVILGSGGFGGLEPQFGLSVMGSLGVLGPGVLRAQGEPDYICGIWTKLHQLSNHIFFTEKERLQNP